jgi:uncharacterized membrane protein
MSARKVTHWLSHLEAHHRLALSLVFAALVFVLLQGHLQWRTRLIATWDAYALCLLGLAWTRIITAQPRMVVRLTTLQPISRGLIFAFVVVAAYASLASVAYLLIAAKDLPHWQLVSHILLALATIILSWIVLHTIFALHYAHLYYHERGDAHASSIARGLIFPDGDIEPDYLDFAYFSFVIGMTSQVSDVQISSRKFRHWALLHGLISFAFNAAVLALSINILSSLLSS